MRRRRRHARRAGAARLPPGPLRARPPCVIQWIAPQSGRFSGSSPAHREPTLASSTSEGDTEMARLDINTPTLWITAAAMQHPNDLADHVAGRSGVTRRTAHKALARLVELNWLQREGTARKPTWRPGLLRQAAHRYALPGLEEDLPWSRDFAPHFALPPHVQRITQHCFCELLNNAIDHSEGTSVAVSLRQTPSHVQLLVSDDGRGVFDKIHEAFALDDPALAMLELSKCKLTSQPLRLITSSLASLESRAQARRVTARLQQFRRAEVDFTGVPHIGHGFADELFRVYARQQPGFELVPVNMSPAVATLIDSVRRAP